MQITANIDEHEYGQIARRMSDNLTVTVRFIRETAIRGRFAGRTSYSVRLGVVDMDGDYARRTMSGRRMPFACWHAFRDFLAGVYLADPDASVRTPFYKASSAAQWLDVFPASGDRNIGSESEVRPFSYSEACDCGGGVMSSHVVALRDAVLAREVSAS